MTKDDDDTMCYRSELEAAVKAEREACADLTEQMGICGYGTLAIAAAIRARNQDPMPLFDDWNKDWK